MNHNLQRPSRSSPSLTASQSSSVSDSISTTLIATFDLHNFTSLEISSILRESYLHKHHHEVHPDPRHRRRRCPGQRQDYPHRQRPDLGLQARQRHRRGRRPARVPLLLQKPQRGPGRLRQRLPARQDGRLLLWLRPRLGHERVCKYRPILKSIVGSEHHPNLSPLSSHNRKTSSPSRSTTPSPSGSTAPRSNTARAAWSAS